MKILHDYIRKHHFTYAQLGLSLNKGNAKTFLKRQNKRIDCSSYVSYVLWVSGIEIGNRNSDWYASKKYSEYKQYNWSEIRSANDLQPGDILTRHGHVEFYRKDNTTYCAGSGGCINKEYSKWRSKEAMLGSFDFAIRVSKDQGEETL